MEDGRRFLRYVIPGLTLIVEFFGYLLISGDIGFIQLIGHVETIGAATSFFLASGVLGFLLGVIYYIVVWWEWPKIARIGGDLRPLLQHAEAKGWLKLNCCGKDVETEKLNKRLSKRGAWRVIISYLNMRSGTSKQIKEAIRGMDRLSDLMNGLGTACLASLLAFIFFLIYNVIHNWRGEFSLAGFLSAVMLFFHYWNYRGVVEDYENVFRSILWKEFEYEYRIKLYVFKNDLRKYWSKRYFLEKSQPNEAILSQDRTFEGSILRKYGNSIKNNFRRKIRMSDDILLAITLNFPCPSCGQLNTKPFVEYVVADSSPCVSCGFEIPIHRNKELSLGLKVVAKRITEK